MAEAIVLLLDVGRSMGKESDSSDVSYFERAKLCASMIVERKIFSKTKDELGLILLGSERTNNPHDDGELYQHIDIVHRVQLPNWNLIKTIALNKNPTTVDSDWFDGLVVGLDFMKNSIEGKKFCDKQIVLFTNFKLQNDGANAKYVSDDTTKKVVDHMKALGVKIVGIGPHFHKLDSKGNDNQVEGERLIATIAEETGGCVCSFEDAIPQLMRFEKKKQKSVPWRATMEIGSSMKIPVVGYIKTSEVKRVQTKNIVLPSHDDKTSHIVNHQAENQNPKPDFLALQDEDFDNEDMFEDNAAPVERDRVYTTVADIPTPIDVKDVIEGYMFGSTIIPVTDDDKKGISYQAGEKSLQVLGFTNICNVPQRYFIGTKCMLFFPEKEENTMGAFAALLQGMDSKDMVAIVRKVYRKNAVPEIGALVSDINEQYQCLIYRQLPFSQDVRTLLFPPLLKDGSLPSKDQLNAVDQLIEAMDLMALDVDDDELPVESYQPEECLDPTEQNYYHFVAGKILGGSTIVNAKDALDTVKELTEPRKDVILKANQALKCIEELFPLKEIKPKEGARRAAKDTFGDVKSEQSESTEDKQKNTSLGSDNAPLTAIGTVHPQDDFLNLIALGTSFYDACTMMQSVIRKMVDHFDEDDYNKPFKALMLLRKECASRDPAIYNEWVKQYKKTLLNEKEGFWELIVKDRLGLITQDENIKSSISADEANSFLIVEDGKKDIMSSAPMEEDLDDLINQM